MKVAQLAGEPLRLEVLVDPPKFMPMLLPVHQAEFPKVIARIRDATSGPSVLIVLPQPPLGGTVVAEVSLASFLEAAALLEAKYGRPGGGGVILATPSKPPGGPAG